MIREILRMIQENYEVIIGRIMQQTSLPKGEIEGRIERKLVELHDLVSKEGAAHMIANELKVNVFEGSSPVPNTAAKVGDVKVGMNALNLTVKVMNVFEVRSFNAKGRQGRVASFVVGDETGTVRLVVWDEKCIEEMKEVREGAILKFKNGYVKENAMKYKEVHLGNKAQIEINPANEFIGEVRRGNVLARKKVSEVSDGENAEIFGTIVQIFEPKYYNACPACNKKVFPQGETFACQTHGSVVAVPTPILNLFIDDGTGVLRIVLFRDMAKKIVAPEANFETVKTEQLGRQVMVRGKIARNAMFDRFEMVVNEIEEASPEKLLAEMQP